MRKNLTVSLALMSAIVLLFSACSAEDPTVIFHNQSYRLAHHEDGLRRYEGVGNDSTLSVQTTTTDEWDYIVTIDGEQYFVSGDAQSFSVAFPDERILRRTRSDNMSTGSTAPGTQTSFEDWDTVDALGTFVFGVPATKGPGTKAPGKSPGLRIVGFIIMVSGLVSVFNPRLAFFMELGWRIRDAEPSETYLAFSRVVGVVLIIVGLVMLLG